MVLGGLPPVGELGLYGVRWVVGDGEAAALVLKEDVCVDVAVAQGGDGAYLFGVDLAAVAGELDGAETLADGAERATSLDLGELVGIADADELALGGGDVLGEPLVFARADHAGLVDQEHGAGREGLASVEVGEEARGVESADASLLL
jgi:hypothetical protein